MLAVHSDGAAGTPNYGGYSNYRPYDDGWIPGTFQDNSTVADPFGFRPLHNSGETSSSVQPTQTLNSVQDLFPAIRDTLLSLSNSSVQAEKAAADAANAFEWKLQKDQQSFNSTEALKAFERNQISADKQMAFQTAERLASQQEYRDLRDTQYQSAVADLAAAGLNPALAIDGLSGASSSAPSPGSGAQAAASAAHASGGSARKADISSALGVQQRMASSILSAVVQAASNELSSSTKYGTGTISGVASVLGTVAGALLHALL